ncbi:hypothetical protein Riv7116_3176 [Rivularia sp. PCC 7116]|uniref:hypothetical protein n=1 Tax=Rivularia sp. PCC 7116 TaxID=373994 RepID=UPI00029F1FD0|nr:hypothetical protein [Rivularia sp. PCC 7116]AFY55649.1 hypothetical protein Riv7116_3176 [Rivularia sp. PCC 7116]
MELSIIFNKKDTLVAFAMNYVKKLGKKPKYYPEMDEKQIIDEIYNYQKVLDETKEIFIETLIQFYRGINKLNLE